jgi:hypothetical protein
MSVDDDEARLIPTFTMRGFLKTLMFCESSILHAVVLEKTICSPSHIPGGSDVSPGFLVTSLS